MFFLIFVLVGGIIGYLFLKYFSNKSISTFKAQPSQKVKGIVYFDIDDTLSTAHFNHKEAAIDAILNKGYGVGIITASDRTIEHVCSGNQANQELSPWMPDSLCGWMSNRDFDTYNSRSLTAGKRTTLPNFGGTYEEIGRKKGWQMKHGMELLGIEDASKVILLDDNTRVIEDASQYFPHGRFINVNNNNDALNALTNKMVESIIEFEG